MPRKAQATGEQPETRKRYEQVAEALIGEIRARRIGVGETLPGELELTERFGVSRHTVREALRRLEELGLIDRQQGVGTVVRARQPTQSYVQTVRTPAELLQYPPESKLVVVGTGEVRSTRKLARQLGCATGAKWFRISCLRRLKDSKVPICWVDVYVLPDYASIADQIGRRQPVYEAIEQRFGQQVAAVEIDLRAGLIAPEIAKPLDVAPGTPSLTVIRRYHGPDRRLFEVSVSEHPAERYTYSLQLKRGWQSGAPGGWSAG
jgi:DNA-binding GntR family transcriptional regulator